MEHSKAAQRFLEEKIKQETDKLYIENRKLRLLVVKLLLDEENEDVLSSIGRITIPNTTDKDEVDKISEALKEHGFRLVPLDNTESASIYIIAKQSQEEW